jgi:hypothetical protein
MHDQPREGGNHVYEVIVVIETLLIMRTNCWHKLYAAKERTTGFA